MSLQNDAVDHLRYILQIQTEIIDRIIHQLSEFYNKNPNDKVLSVTLLMIQNLGSSMHSALMLTSKKDMAIRDCFGIARSASELAVNICYIGVTGEKTAELAERHAMQKLYRDLSRKGEIGGMTFHIKREQVPEAHEIPEMESALAEFTEKNGKEKRHWTPESLSMRIEKVRQFHDRSATSLSGAILLTYRHASEFIHGTYFSVLYFWPSKNDGNITRDDYLEKWIFHFHSIFGSLFFSASAVIELFGSLYELPEDLIEVQKELYLEAQKIIKL
jgi:hypothetical protein